MTIILKAYKVNFFVSSVLFVFWYHSPNVLDTPRIKENAEALVVASMEIGLETNADKTKYMFMSRDQNAGRSHSTKTDNNLFERAEEIKYFGTFLTNHSLFR
jgi:hypothetical protein